MRLCAPAYIYPTAPAWDELIAELVPGDLVVANVDSGVGTQRSQEWATVIDRCHGRGAAVLGYVPLGYLGPLMGEGGRPRDVDEMLGMDVLWRGFYNVDGIFHDEAPIVDIPGRLSMLRKLHGYPRNWVPDVRTGLRRGVSCWNPGAGPVPPEWLRSLPGSLWTTFEGSADTYLMMRPRPANASSAAREIHLIYSCAVEQEQAVRNHAWAASVGYGSLTADGLDGNAYDSTPQRLG